MTEPPRRTPSTSDGDAGSAFAVSYEDRMLELPGDPGLWPQSFHDAAASPYRAAIVPEIADLDVRVGRAAASDAAEAAAEIARFDAEFMGLPIPFGAVLLRSEAASSSELEAISVSARELAEAELVGRPRGDAGLVVSNVRAMESAIRLAERIDDASCIELHRALLGERQPDGVGRYRSSQVWIAGRLPHDAAFVPPHPDRVPAAMADFTRFAARRDIPALEHVAVAHAQFESIHPFPDGNGRTGRAIVQSMLRRGRLTRQLTIPVSGGLLGDIGAYHAALMAYRDGDPDPIVTEFGIAAHRGLDNARQLARQLTELREAWRVRLAGVRSDAAAHRLAEATIGHPALDLATAMRLTGASQPATGNAIDRLVDRGVLEPADARRRGRTWLNREVLDALDAYAARSLSRRLY